MLSIKRALLPAFEIIVRGLDKVVSKIQFCCESRNFIKKTFYQLDNDDMAEINEIARKAFLICDTEDPQGLTWDEVADCEDKFCGVLAMQCPTEADFENSDLNGDGVLTWTEYQNAQQL